MTPRLFRDAMGQFATGITIVTCCRDDGLPVGLTVNSFNSVSLDPPLILFSLGRDADCYVDVVQAKWFNVNILAEHQSALSSQFASDGQDRFKAVDWHAGSRGCPVLADVLAVFECSVETTYPGGDHLILIGRVENVITGTGGTPLVYFQGAYSKLRPA